MEMFRCTVEEEITKIEEKEETQCSLEVMDMDTFLAELQGYMARMSAQL